MPTDGATAKFLYTILKQLDLKSIDWTTVAAALEITNGHAARMRFSRFKQAMEGVVPAPRRRTTTTPRVKKPKAAKDSPSASTSKKRGFDEVSKADDDEPIATRVKKEEPVDDGRTGLGVPGSDEHAGTFGAGDGTTEQMGSMTLGQADVPMHAPMTGEGIGAVAGVCPPEDPGFVKKEPVVKMEPVPGWDD